MTSEDDNGSEREETHPIRRSTGLLWLAGGFLLLYLAVANPVSDWSRAELSYTEFKRQLELDNVASVHVRGQEIQGEFRNA
jgi:hypothetical protein